MPQAQTTTQTTENKKVFPFKIGADPEFLLFHGKRGLDAKSILTNFFKNKTNLQKMDYGYLIEDKGEFGWDGASSTGELRPNAEYDPKKLTENIGKLIETIHKELPFIDFTTLSIGAPIGGHIHLEIPKTLFGENFKGTNYGYPGDEITKKMNKLTKLIASFMMPIIASEHRISTSSRLATQYGRADDIKYESHGSGSKMFLTAEVRGMSAEWITSPEVTYATLCYMGVIWNEVMKRSDELIKEKVMLKTKGHILSIQQMMLADYKPVEKGITNGIAKLVRQFEMYPQFKNEVEFILHPSDVLKTKEKAGWNMEKGWIGKTKNGPSKKTLLSEKKVTEKLKSDQSLIENTVGIPFNDDHNCNLFAQAISNRIALFNWKLNNNYFIYGLKKEIEGFAVMNQQNNKFYAIPTNNDKAKTIDSCMKMANKYMQSTNSGIKIDPKTGKITTRKSSAIVIGIPYSLRAENNVKPLIELIWGIEKGKIKEKTIDEFATPTTRKNAKTDAQEVVENSVYRNGNNIQNEDDNIRALLENEITNE